ncbi:hypothetical protein [Rhodococcoides kroppenstedtii]|uniref:hypothetical protein n=1 Tax=Rhodococcoides kroppenstedtii TaxID=293050 RepID=UPI00362B0E43
MTPRRRWIDARTDELEAELASAGVSLPRRELQSILASRVSDVAAQMRVTEPTARKYLTPEAIGSIARSIAAHHVAGEEETTPDLLTAPRSCRTPLAAVGTMIAGLTECLKLDVSAHDTVRHAHTSAVLSITGALLREHDRPDAGFLETPPALLIRVGHIFDTAAASVTDGAPLPAGADESLRAPLAARLGVDAELLRHLADTKPGDPPRPTLRAVRT